MLWQTQANRQICLYADMEWPTGIRNFPTGQSKFADVSLLQSSLLWHWLTTSNLSQQFHLLQAESVIHIVQRQQQFTSLPLCLYVSLGLVHLHLDLQTRCGDLNDARLALSKAVEFCMCLASSPCLSATVVSMSLTLWPETELYCPSGLTLSPCKNYRHNNS